MSFTQKKKVDKGLIAKKQMEELLHQKFFFFYDFLNDGFVDMALLFYEDPYGFDLQKAREDAEKSKDNIARVNDVEDSVEAPLVNKHIKRGESPYTITLPNAELDARVEESFRLNPELKERGDINVMKQKAYCLVQQNDEGKNVLHLAGANGNFDLCEFIIVRAGAKGLNILSFIVRTLDTMFRTPLYVLCVKGYEKKFDPIDQRKSSSRKRIIEMLIPPVAEQDQNNLAQYSRWAYVAPQVSYTPLHWLAFWNDAESIHYILNLIPKTVEDYSKIMAVNFSGLTPLDIAGQHGCHEAAIMMINHLTERFDFVMEIFNANNGKNLNQTTPLIDNNNTHSKQWELRIVKHTQLTKIQFLFGSLYYWAAYYGLFETVDLFLGKLGISPFIKLYNNKNVIDAAVEGSQYEMLEYLAANSRQQIKDPNGQLEPSSQKYKIQNPKDVEYYWKSRANKDRQGNNPCHYAFSIPDLKLRYKVIKLLIQEEIGDPYKRNKMGMLPEDLEHDTQYHLIDDDVKHYFRETLQETHEADYMIVTSQTKNNKGKVNIILEQLSQLELEEAYEVYTTDRTDTPEDVEEGKQTVYISIKMPEHIMNETADELGVETTLQENGSDVFIKAPYNKKVSHSFIVFDADERMESILEYLGNEIDFDYFMTSGIIEEHYMLHKRETVTEILKSFHHYKWRLIRGMIIGNYTKYFEPLNMIKNYYGEKYAFEYAFLIHYAAWLLIPGISGILVVIKMVYAYYTTSSFSDSIDTDMNGAFGIFLSVWATCFLESWRRKQRNIQYYWNCGDNSYSPQDERSDDFKFYFFFNESTDSLEKIAKEPKKWKRRGQQCLQVLLILVVLIMIQIYQYVSAFFKDKVDSTGNITKKADSYDYFIGQGVTFVYQLMIINLGATYRDLAAKITYDENPQYQQDYDDSFIVKVFLFNFFNFYFPMISIAFIKGKYEPIFVMLLTQQGFKQNWANFKEYIIPIYEIQPKIDKLNEEFKETIDKYKKDSLTPVEEVICKPNDPMSIRKYQCMKNDALYNEKANIIGDYMELIAQFGFICLFSEVFPPASLCSFVCNFIQMKSQINNFKYTRRFKAEVGNGIGSFMDCLEILTQLSVISNCALLFWTSKYFKLLFVSAGNEDATIKANNPGLASVKSITEGWTQTDFLKAVIYVEHVIILFQIFLKQVISDVTPKIITGERNRSTLLATHLKKAEEGVKPNIPQQSSESILQEDDNQIEKEWDLDNANSIVVVPSKAVDNSAGTDFKKQVKIDFMKKIKKIDKIAFDMREIRTQALLKQASQEQHAANDEANHHHHHLDATVVKGKDEDTVGNFLPVIEQKSDSSKDKVYAPGEKPAIVKGSDIWNDGLADD